MPEHERGMQKVRGLRVGLARWGLCAPGWLGRRGSLILLLLGTVTAATAEDSRRLLG